LKISGEIPIVFTRSYLSAFVDSSTNAKLKLPYKNYPELLEIVSRFTERVAEVYALTAFGEICAQCGSCCKRENIFVQGSEIFKIASLLEMSVDSFRNKYLVFTNTWNRYDGILKLKKGRCPFLKKNKSGRNSCSIYTARPGSCKNIAPMTSTCSKEAGILITYLKKLEVKGYILEVSLIEPINEDYNKELSHFRSCNSFMLTDETLINLLQEIRNFINKIKINYEDPLDAFIYKSMSLMKKYYNNMDDPSLRDSYEEYIKDFRELIDDISIYFSSDEHAERINELWNMLDSIEEKAETIRESLKKNDGDSEFLIKTNNSSVKALTLLPESITIHATDKDGEPCPYSFPLLYDKDLLEAVRELVKTLVSQEGRDIQQILSDTEPLCYLCGECCSVYAVEITPRDISRIAENLNITEKQFQTKYLLPNRFSWNRHNGVLKKAAIEEGEDRQYCVFLKREKSGFYFCDIYQYRPEVCSKFSPNSSMCMDFYSKTYWYSLLSSVFIININYDKLTLYTSHTFNTNSQSLPILWRENEVLTEKVEEVINIVKLRTQGKWGIQQVKVETGKE
jgi:Fe-S-cluster containining protein